MVVIGKIAKSRMKNDKFSVFHWAQYFLDFQIELFEFLDIGLGILLISFLVL